MTFFLLSLLFVTPAIASEAPLRITAGYMPSKDASACPSYFKKRIARFPGKSRYDFRFTCLEGKLRELYTEPESSIAADWISFCKNNPELLGLPGKDLTVEISGPNRSLVQSFRGIQIGEPCLGQQIIHPTLGHVFRLTVGAVDTSHWKLRTAAAISSSTAAGIALRTWQQQAPDTIQKPESVILQILNLTDGPKLVWNVTGGISISKVGEARCVLDAQTGEEISPLACDENAPIPGGF